MTEQEKCVLIQKYGYSSSAEAKPSVHVDVSYIGALDIEHDESTLVPQGVSGGFGDEQDPWLSKLVARPGNCKKNVNFTDVINMAMTHTQIQMRESLKEEPESQPDPFWIKLLIRTDNGKKIPKVTS